MFDSLRNMAGLAGLMKDLPRIKSKLDDVKSRLGDLRASAETGGGVVRATCNGRLRLVALEIDRALMAGLVSADSAEDRALAQDLVAGAVNAALDKAQEMAAREFGAAAEELGLPLPPGGLPGLL